MANPYTILGLRPGATEEEIWAAFRLKTKIHHPDAVGGSTEAQQELNKAKEEALADVKLAGHVASTNALVLATAIQNQLVRIEELRQETARREKSAEKSLKRVLDLSMAPHRKRQLQAAISACIMAIFSLLSFEKLNPIADALMTTRQPSEFVAPQIAGAVAKQRAKLSITEMKTVNVHQIVALHWQAWVTDAEWMRVNGFSRLISYQNLILFLAAEELPSSVSARDFESTVRAMRVSYDQSPELQEKARASRRGVAEKMGAHFAAEPEFAPNDQAQLGEAMIAVRAKLASREFKEMTVPEKWRQLEPSLRMVSRGLGISPTVGDKYRAVVESILFAVGIALSLDLDAEHTRAEASKRDVLKLINFAFLFVTIGLGAVAAVSTLKISNSKSRLEHLDGLLSNRDNFLAILKTIVRETSEEGWSHAQLAELVGTTVAENEKAEDAVAGKAWQEFGEVYRIVKNDVGLRDFVDLLIKKGEAIGVIQSKQSSEGGFPQQRYSVVRTSQDFAKDHVT